MAHIRTISDGAFRQLIAAEIKLCGDAARQSYDAAIQAIEDLTEDGIVYAFPDAKAYSYAFVARERGLYDAGGDAGPVIAIGIMEYEGPGTGRWRVLLSRACHLQPYP